MPGEDQDPDRGWGSATGRCRHAHDLCAGAAFGLEETATRGLALPYAGHRLSALRVRVAHRLQRDAELREDVARDDCELHGPVGWARELPLHMARLDEPG